MVFFKNFVYSEISIIYFVVASITDGLDGFIARKMNWQTELGTLLDPVADKILLSGSIFILWLNQYIPFYIFVIFFSRDVAILLGAAIRMTIIESDTPTPNFLGKLTTTLQIIYIAIIFLREIIELHFGLLPLDVFIILVTVLSLVVYTYNWVRDLSTYHNE